MLFCATKINITIEPVPNPISSPHVLTISLSAMYNDPGKRLQMKFGSNNKIIYSTYVECYFLILTDIISILGTLIL